MSEGTENAEAQKPSKYKGFGQKVWRVRSQESEKSEPVLEALIDLSLRLPGESFGGAIGRPGTFCEPAASQIE